MIDIVTTAILWGGICFLALVAAYLLHYPALAIYRIIEAVTFRATNSPALAEKKARKHTFQLYEQAKRSNPQTREDFANAILTEKTNSLLGTPTRRLPCYSHSRYL